MYVCTMSYSCVELGQKCVDRKNEKVFKGISLVYVVTIVTYSNGTLVPSSRITIQAEYNMERFLGRNVKKHERTLYSYRTVQD